MVDDRWMHCWYGSAHVTVGGCLVPSRAKAELTADWRAASWREHVFVAGR